MLLRDIVIYRARQIPEALAVKGKESITYGELNRLADQFARALSELGVQNGDRVGIWLEKSTRAVAAMQGILRLNAIYVPLDPLSPVARIHTILCDCEIRVLVTTQRRAQEVLADEEALQLVTCLNIDENGFALHGDDLINIAHEPRLLSPSTDDDIAYILYTSGSTGKPKGVCITNRNALAFIEWAANELQATSSDRFANHAPFHFDLSVLDLYTAFYVGAAVFLIPEGTSYIPNELVNFIIREKLTIWYSVPSTLLLMIERGGLLEVESLTLRAILFAGEPFPIKHLRRLYRRWSTVRFLNLYGPTETNVCTFYEVTSIPEDQTVPVPIGRACSGDEVWAQKENGDRALPGEHGELIVSGPTVMAGYWGQLRERTIPYATGDLVRLEEDGNYTYISRRDHMIKVRGYRVEPGDIEAALLEHPGIYETAVFVVGSGMTVRLVAAIVTTNDAEAPSLLEMKKHCAERLPRYMIIDDIYVLPALPRTENGKIDRLALLAMR